MKLSRRKLLKLAAGSAGAALVLGSGVDFMEHPAEGAGVSRTTGKQLVGIPSTCLNCYARCGIVGYIDGEYLYKIGGNASHPNSKGRTCAKGQAGINIANDPDRIITPLKRTGARGEKKFKKITWQKAIAEIASRLNEIKEEGKPEKFVFQSLRDVTTARLVKRFVHAFGSPNALVNNALGKENKRFAQLVTWGEEIPINDVANCRYILNFGSNPYEAHLLRTSFVQRITEGRTTTVTEGGVHYGSKMVTFDVRCSQTAGKSDEWHPINPGTDGVVALAMANVIMTEGEFDEEFINEWTNISVEELRNHLSHYTLRFASKISGVPEDDIRRVALEYSRSSPATTISTGGVSKHSNGVYNERCIMLLNAICGNIDVKGGYCLPRYYHFTEPSPVPAEPSGNSRFFGKNGFETPHDVLNMIRDGRQEIGVLMTYQHNLVYANPDSKAQTEILKDEKLIPFYVAIDDHMSEGAAYADIILPSSTYLERLELESPPAFEMVPFVSLRQPVVPPPGECKSITEMLIDLAWAIGDDMGKYFSFTPERYINLQLAGIPMLVDAGGLAYLKENGVWFDEYDEPAYRKYEKDGFNTPSGKFEIHSTRLEEMGFNPLPVFEPVAEHDNMAEDALILTKFQWNVHTHFHTANCMWLSEIVHHNPVWINSKTAYKLGIGHGDLVEITSAIGSIESTAFVTEGVHPGVLALSDNVGHWEYGHVARAEKYDSIDPNTGLVWWEHEGAGTHPNLIIPVRHDPIGGGQAWMDTVVKIRKLKGKPELGFFEKYFGFLAEE